MYDVTMPRKTHGKKTQMMLTPMTMAMHAKLKVRAREEGRSMAAIVRELLDEYLGVAHQETQDVYDELSERFSEMLS